MGEPDIVAWGQACRCPGARPRIMRPQRAKRRDMGALTFECSCNVCGESYRLAASADESANPGGTPGGPET